MGYTVQDNGDIIVTQGDSFELVLNGIPTDQNYKVYFAIQDAERNPIGTEIMVESNHEAAVTIKVTGNYSNQLVVEEDSKTTTYYYGVKICSTEENTEDTLLLGNKTMGEQNTIKVYPRKVEGI